jgi:hypothetical protein
VARFLLQRSGIIPLKFRVGILEDVVALTNTFPPLPSKHFSVSLQVVIPSTILSRLSSGTGTIGLSDVKVPRDSPSHISLLQLLRPCEVRSTQYAVRSPFRHKELRMEDIRQFSSTPCTSSLSSVCRKSGDTYGLWTYPYPNNESTIKRDRNYLYRSFPSLVWVLYPGERTREVMPLCGRIRFRILV